MADHFTRFSFAVPLDGAVQIEWATQAVAYIESVRDEQHNPVDTDEFFAVLPEDPEFYSYGVEVDEDGLWFHDEESGSIDDLIPFVQAYLAKFDPKGSVGAEWADVCSRPIIDSFGGGGILITATGYTSMHSGQWIYEQTKPLWENDLIQFARLLDEIRATQENIDYDALCESMDLEADRIVELFERAMVVFEKSKEGT